MFYTEKIGGLLTLFPLTLVLVATVLCTANKESKPAFPIKHSLAEVLHRQHSLEAAADNTGRAAGLLSIRERLLRDTDTALWRRGLWSAACPAPA